MQYLVPGILLGTSIPNAVTDVITVSLLMPYIWAIKRSLGQNVAVYGVFHAWELV
ncbi:hypothetical protein K432DRAFT_384149 [Lepidopterella palustris CBS 459.81]|uniref:Uncharacterized protein n=1 Tax=Lepidopterella palustris CBS 459.81 TaxID=1314670 RepID=A0A8E2JD53_9PEZI|nr:hypothetical protein K432DRAFT_384149 [Lepidopterella palustris CBS 459.81]